MNVSDGENTRDRNFISCKTVKAPLWSLNCFTHYFEVLLLIVVLSVPQHVLCPSLIELVPVLGDNWPVSFQLPLFFFVDLGQSDF